MGVHTQSAQPQGKDVRFLDSLTDLLSPLLPAPWKAGVDTRKKMSFLCFVHSEVEVTT